MVPSCAGGSSTPFLGAPWVRTGCGGPQGLFLVLLSVRCAAVHMRQQDSHTGYLPRRPPIEKSRPGPGGLRTGIHHQNTGVRKKNPKKSRIHGNPPGAPRVLLHVRPGASGAPGRAPSSPAALLHGRGPVGEAPPAHEAPARSSPTAESARSANPTPLSPDSHWLRQFSRTSAGPQPSGSPHGPVVHPPEGPIRRLRGPDRPRPIRRGPVRSQGLRARSGAASGGPRPCR